MSRSGDLLSEARAALAAGDPRSAAVLARRHLDLQSGDAEALALLANCGARLADPTLALEGLRPLLQQRPEQPSLRRATADALNMQAARLRAAGQPDSAVAALVEAVELAPRHALAWFNLAAARADLGDTDAAAEALAMHLTLAPADDEARLLQARVLRRGQPDAAARALSALSGTARLEDAFAQADALDRDGAATAARSAYAALQVLCNGSRTAPGLRAAIGARLALPAVCASTDDMRSARARYDEGLAELEHGWEELLAQAAPGLEQLIWCNFKLAYHGMDDRPLQERYATLLVGAAGRLAPAFASPLARRRPRARARVALLSSGFRECTVGAYFGGWIDWLRQAGYELRLYQLGARDAVTDALARRAGHLHHHRGGIDALAAQVRSDAPDLLLYPELGMDPRLLPLAALRLAPLQAVGWGHPVTTGLSTLDAWFSCAAMEPPAAAADYAEPLRLLPGLGVRYDAPQMPPTLPRVGLGLPDDAPLALVPQSLFKLHPDFDATLAAVAAGCPGLRLVLFEGEVPAWTAQVRARLSEALTAAGASADQLLWLPVQPRQRYLAINAACDLMIDAPQWSGGNTALDALLCGLPLLALRGRFMRGRQSSAMLELMGMDEALVCADTGELVQRAHRLIDDRASRLELSSTLRAGRNQLLQADAAQAGFLAHVDALLKRR